MLSLRSCASASVVAPEDQCHLNPVLRALVERVIRRLTKDQHLDGFTDEQLHTILDAMYAVLQPMPSFVKMDAPVVIFGDIHGQLTDLQRFFSLVGTPGKIRSLFLGDYVDRGKKSIEVTILLFCFKLRYPDRVELLRGNHECAKMNRLYGFYEECRRTRSVALWKKFQRVFNELPLCALVSRRIFCMHGGLSPEITGWAALDKLMKPRSNIEADRGMALDLMWSDPNEDCNAKGWETNKMRNASYVFGADVAEEVCKKLDVDLIVRAHEAVKEGHRMNSNNRVCTIFSAPNYCGVEGNSASVMRVSPELEISFVTLKPRVDKLERLSAAQRAELAKQMQKNDAKSPNPGGSTPS